MKMSEEHNPINPDRYLIKGTWLVEYDNGSKMQWELDEPTPLRKVMVDGLRIISAREVK
jgi:hypothetical protein